MPIMHTLLWSPIVDSAVHTILQNMYLPANSIELGAPVLCDTGICITQNVSHSGCT
jgi:hypothetical protein